MEDLTLPAGQEGPERCGGDGRTTNLFYLGSRAFRWLAGVLVRSPTLLAVSLWLIGCGEDNLVQQVDCLIFHLGQPLPVKIGGAPDFSNNTLEMWRSGRRSPGEKEEKRRRNFYFSSRRPTWHLLDQMNEKWKWEDSHSSSSRHLYILSFLFWWSVLDKESVDSKVLVKSINQIQKKSLLLQFKENDTDMKYTWKLEKY